jgi:hypothetical protein
MLSRKAFWNEWLKIGAGLLTINFSFPVSLGPSNDIFIFGFFIQPREHYNSHQDDLLSRQRYGRVGGNQVAGDMLAAAVKDSPSRPLKRNSTSRNNGQCVHVT